jgi:hypothetical protein
LSSRIAPHPSRPVRAGPVRACAAAALAGGRGAGLPGSFAALLRAEVTVGVPMWALTMLTDGWFSDHGRQHGGDDDAAAGARGGTAGNGTTSGGN